MKKLLASILISISLLSPFSAYAQYVVYDPENWIQDGLSLVQENITAIATFTLQSDNILIRILSTAAYIFVSNLINRFAEDTIRWINTGFQGGGPGYIVNPKAYFANVANREMEVQLASIQKTNNIFGNAVIGTAIRGVREGKLPTGNQLQYTLANTVQDSLCTEANITQMAIKAVDGGLTVGGIGMSRDAKISQRKDLLFRQLCSKGPNSSVALQRSLTNCFAADFNCGGWAAYLDLGTNPNNTEYGQAVRAGQLIAAGVNTKDTFAKAEIINGLLSKKKCTKYAGETDEYGTPLPPELDLCLEEKVETPAAAISNLLQSAVQAGPNRANASTGTGIEGILTKLVVAGLNKFTANTFNKSAPNGGGLNSSYTLPLNVSQAGYVTPGSNEFQSGSRYTGDSDYTNISSSSDSGIAPVDTGAAALSSSVKTLRDSLVNVRNIVTSTIATINDYGSSLDGLTACYNTLVSSDPNMNNNPNVISGRAYIQQSKNSFTSKLPGLRVDQSAVTPMINQLGGFITLLENSPTPQTVSSVFTQFSQKKTDGSLFDRTKEVLVQADFNNIARSITKDTEDNLQPKTAECNRLKATISIPSTP